LKLIASGDVDETMLDALEDYVKRQKKQLGLPAKNLGFLQRKRPPTKAARFETGPLPHARWTMDRPGWMAHRATDHTS
jgi:hypothetical protein